MNTIKIVYYNTIGFSGNPVEAELQNNSKYISHIVIKPGLFLVNYNGSAQDLYNSLDSQVKGINIIIYDLDNGDGSFWGYMNRNVWDWINQNINSKSND